MKYEKILQKYTSSDFGYPEFRKMYQEIQYCLEVDIICAENAGRNSDSYRAMRIQIFEWARTLLKDLHTTIDDVDEFGFLDVVDSYLDAAWRLLAKIHRTYFLYVNAVIYDGEINSVVLVDFKTLKEVYHV
jgi:hypothetical protein